MFYGCCCCLFGKVLAFLFVYGWDIIAYYYSIYAMPSNYSQTFHFNQNNHTFKYSQRNSLNWSTVEFATSSTQQVATNQLLTHKDNWCTHICPQADTSRCNSINQNWLRLFTHRHRNRHRYRDSKLKIRERIVFNFPSIQFVDRAHVICNRYAVHRCSGKLVWVQYIYTEGSLWNQRKKYHRKSRIKKVAKHVAYD